MCFQWSHTVILLPLKPSHHWLKRTVRTWEVTLNYLMHFWSTLCNLKKQKKGREIKVKRMMRYDWTEKYWCKKKSLHAHNPLSVKNDDIIRVKFFIFVTEPWAKSNISSYIYTHTRTQTHNRLIAVMTIDLQRPELTSNEATEAKCFKQSVVTGTLRPSFFT